MMIAQKTRASRAVLKKYMDEKVPVNRRLEGVYIPTILTDNVCFLSDYIIQLIKKDKCRAVGPIVKRLNLIIKKYRATNLSVMHTWLYDKVDESSTDFYQFIFTHLIVDQCTYVQELWKQYPEQYQSSVSTILGTTYFTRKIVEYIIQYERDWSDQIQGYLGDSVRYEARDNKTCVAILKCLNEIIGALHGPEELDGYQIQLSYQIFKNRVKHIDVTSIIENKGGNNE